MDIPELAHPYVVEAAAAVTVSVIGPKDKCHDHVSSPAHALSL